MAPLRRRDGCNTLTVRAFTLIELLVVIAIIAILTAILLPVFAAVRENSRQGVSISNLKDIQEKMEQFKLDNHKYPDVLFGYAYPNSTLKTGLGMAQTDHNNDIKNNVTDPATLASHNPAVYFPGLYPAYIKDPNEFTDPNNTAVDDNSPQAAQVTAQLPLYIVAPCSATNDNTLAGRGTAGTSPCSATMPTPGMVVQTQRSFYTQDAYDTNPQVTGANTINAAAPIVRYQTARELTANPIPTTDPTASEYKRQLRWQNPPAETFITCSTYHVKNADKVLVLFESGAVKKMTGEEFATGVTGQTNSEPSNFWQLTP